MFASHNRHDKDNCWTQRDPSTKWYLKRGAMNKPEYEELASDELSLLQRKMPRGSFVGVVFEQDSTAMVVTQVVEEGFDNVVVLHEESSKVVPKTQIEEVFPKARICGRVRRKLQLLCDKYDEEQRRKHERSKRKREREQLMEMAVKKQRMDWKEKIDSAQEAAEQMSIAEEAVQHDGMLIELVKGLLQDHKIDAGRRKRLVYSAIQQTPDAFGCLPVGLRDDPDFNEFSGELWEYYKCYEAESSRVYDSDSDSDDY